MKIMVAGPEGAGTRMLTAILSKTDAEVFHSSPAFRKWVEKPGRAPYKYWAECDKAVLLIRNGPWNEQSMAARGRVVEGNTPRQQIVNDILDILVDMRRLGIEVHVVAYESLVYEGHVAVEALCNNLGISPPHENSYDPIQNGNEKFWLEDGWEGDNRDLRERGVDNDGQF